MPPHCVYLVTHTLVPLWELRTLQGLHMHGAPPVFNFKPRSHEELGASLGLFDRRIWSKRCWCRVYGPAG